MHGLGTLARLNAAPQLPRIAQLAIAAERAANKLRDAYIEQAAIFHGERCEARRLANRPWDAEGN